MNDQTNSALANFIAQREAEAKEAGGEHWDAATQRGLVKQMQGGDPDHVAGSDVRNGAELLAKLGRESGGTVFHDAIASADEATWRKWRDTRPNRAERIRRSR